MFDVPINSTLDCKTYFSNPELHIPKFLVFHAISQCIENVEGGRGAGYGVDLFISAVANEYFNEARQIMVIYDESWDITEMVIKMTSQTGQSKSFVTYFLPLNATLSSHTESRPPDHLTHKLLPKGSAFIVFVKDESGFANILSRMGAYPWWNKRARFLIMVKDKSLEPTKGILELLESNMIFSGVVVTEFVVKNNSTDSNSTSVSAANPSTHNQEGHGNGSFGGAAVQGVDLQVVALDPYPAPGHPKQAFVARWRGSGYTSLIQPIFQERLDNLRGNKLRAVVFEFPPLVIKNEIEPGRFEYSGQEVKIFQEFAKILNFTYEFTEPPNGTRWGVNLGDNNWTGLIGEIQRNADFGFASIFLLDNREQAIDVSNPYDQDSGCFAVPRPESLKSWVGLLLPFSWQVWACILAMAFVAGPIFSGITRPLNMDKSMTIGRGIFYAMGSLVSAQKAPIAKSHSLRTFIVVWLVFCWLSFILYRVSLIVSLTTGPSIFKLDTIKQLLRSGLEWGGYIEVLKTFTNTTGTKQQEKSDQKMFERFIEITNMTEALDRVVEEADFAVLNSEKYLRYKAKGVYFNGYSSGFHIMQECPTRYNVGFGMPTGSPFLDKINELITRLQSAGLIEKWLQEILHEAALKRPGKQKKGRTYALSLDNMKLCYIIFFCGHFCAFIAFCVEKARTEYVQRKGLLLVRRMTRKISIISATAKMIPSFIITEPRVESGSKNEKFEPIEEEKSERMVRLRSPNDLDAIIEL